MRQVRDAQRLRPGGKPQIAKQCVKRIRSGQRAQERLPVRSEPPHQCGCPGQLVRVLQAGGTVRRRLQDGKTLGKGAAGIGCEAERCPAAGVPASLTGLEKAVARKGTCPHQIGARRIMLELFSAPPQDLHHIPCKGLQQSVGHVFARRRRKIQLQDPAENTKSIGNDLCLGKGPGIGRVEENEAGGALGIVPGASHPVGPTGQHHSAVERSGSQCGGDDPHRQGVVIHDAPPGPEVCPEIPAVNRRHGDGLTAVDDGAAAHAYYQIDLLLPRHPGASLDGFIIRPRLNAGELHDPLPGGAQAAADPVIRSVLPPGAHPTDQQRIGAVASGKAGQIFPHAAAAEYDLPAWFQEKIFQCVITPPFSALCIAAFAYIIKKSRLQQKSRKVMQYIPSRNSFGPALRKRRHVSPRPGSV